MKGAFKKAFTSIIAEPFIFGVVVTTVLHSFVFPIIGVSHNSFNLIVGSLIVGVLYLLSRFMYLKFFVKDKSTLSECFEIETEYDYLYMQEPTSTYKLKKNASAAKKSNAKKIV